MFMAGDWLAGRAKNRSGEVEIVIPGETYVVSHLKT
jgi:hypothetical protein